MSNPQPEAIRLADDIDVLATRFSEGWHEGIKIDATDIMNLGQAAKELRRLHEVNQELVEISKRVLRNKRGDGDWLVLSTDLEDLESALAKARGTE